MLRDIATAIHEEGGLKKTRRQNRSDVTAHLLVSCGSGLLAGMAALRHQMDSCQELDPVAPWHLEQVRLAA
eukprot:4296392-Amphidinium_carterae.1